MICVLRVIDGPAQGSQLYLSGNQKLVIGRVSTADFCVPADQHMSRSHLTIEGSESAFQVVDMGSSNGTFLNNYPVNRADLSSGDVIRAGKSAFEVQLKDAVSGKETQVRSDQIPSRTLSAANDYDFNKRQMPDLTKTTLPLECSFISQLCDALKGFNSTSPVSHSLSLGDQASNDRTQPSEQPKSAPGNKIDSVFSGFAKLHSRLAFVINARQVEDSQLVRNANCFFKLTDTILIAQQPSYEISMRLFQMCFQKDALVVVGSRKPIPRHWFEFWQDQMCYPSLLESHMGDANRPPQITSEIDFVLFEPSRAGQLKVVLSDSVKQEIAQLRTIRIEPVS